ncbi:DMT family transporter [Paenalkalicoccus suaedae]|uniref:DMT family transporter n=1 Tax=Paenalkalicoccus suaedae TaxID=2592382 RepID=A0A859FGD7_9BACI|nr:DMT family transporter [Paenalkalicoccus suaedae]QKS71265.1 DMT family transporter [Paenalkalicoccus suaedae]
MNKSVTYIILLGVMVIWGLNVVAVKYLVEAFPPVMMQGLRIGLAGVVTITLLFFLKDLRAMTKREWGYTLLAAMLGQVAHHSLLAIGLVNTTAGNASLILGLIPLTTAILTMIFLGEIVTRLRFLGIALGFIGVLFIVLSPEEGTASVSSGDLLVLLSMIAQAFSFIVIRKITVTLSSRQMTAVMLLVGSVSLILISLVLEPASASAMTSPSITVWIVFLTSAIFATGLGHLVYNGAIQKIGAGQTAVFNNFVPFFALIGSYYFLGEQIFVSQLIGFVFIVLGVLLGTGYIEARFLARRQKRQV